MRTPATRFEDLVVWQKAHQFVLAASPRFHRIEYGDVPELIQLLEEVSKLLEVYSRAILNYDF